MVMKRRHRENPFAGELETQHLENHRDRFDHKNAADDDEKQFLFATDRDDADQAADCERAGVAHKNFGRMTIEPEKTETGADERGTNDRQLGGERIKWNLQIFRDAIIAARISKKGVGKCN